MNRRAPVIVILVSIVLAVLLFVLLVLPTMREVTRTEEAVEQARAEEISLQAELARLQDIREDAPRFRRQLARLRRAVPPVADLPGVITNLQHASEVADVDFFSISPGTPVAFPEASASEIPAELQVIGGFFQVDEFLFRLETLPRAAKVTSVTVGAGPDGLPQIQVAMSVELYTTDTTAGPGTTPEEVDATTPEPGESPSPGESPTATPTPSPTEA